MRASSTWLGGLGFRAGLGLRVLGFEGLGFMDLGVRGFWASGWACRRWGHVQVCSTRLSVRRQLLWE